MRPAGVAAVFPCFNNADTLERAVASVRVQTVACDPLVLVDDGSTDETAAMAEHLGLRVVRLPANMGRGAARNRGMNEVDTEFVLWCDGTILIPPNFVETALPYFEDERVAAVQGRLVDPHPRGVVARWRARHLYKQGHPCQVTRQAMLATTACVVRRKAVISAGNFNPDLRHSEDAELGCRLLERGCLVVMDPDLHLDCLKPPDLAGTLERYWRWYAGTDEAVDVGAYFRNVKYAMTSMMKTDLSKRDPVAAVISFLCPHYQFWRSFCLKLCHP